MAIFVTGLGGYLGRAIAALDPTATGSIRSRPAASRGHVFALDIRDPAAVASALDAVRPDAVIHTAYQQDGPDARSINVDGAATVARAARDRGLRLVHLSTDVIFDGKLGRPIREDDPPSPVTDYGATKADAERVVVAEHPDAVLIRTSLIYGGAEPSNHERTALDPERTFYTDEIRCPIAAPDLAAAAIELAARAEIRGPLHVAGADAVSRFEFAQLVARANGEPPDAVRGTARPPARPADLSLDCSLASRLLTTRLRGVREVLG
jgi:dTDP-4-dehydrorhamnose reductase